MIRGKRAFLANILFSIPAYRLFKRFMPHHLVIFNYHRIRTHEASQTTFDDGVYGPTQGELRAQLTWLKENTEIVSERELIEHIRGNRPFSKSATMITFDDGYRDNAELALPILKELQIPAIFFISTQAIEERGLGWWDNIAYLIKNTKLSQISLQGRTYILTGNRKKVIRDLQEKMRTHRTEETEFLVEELARVCELRLPENHLSSQELMSWDQIKEAHDAGITIGSHTHSHRVLSTLSHDEQVHEFKVSKRILEEKLGTTIRSVAYPVGGYEDCHCETGGIAEKCGYELGFSFQTGFNPISEINPFNVRRISSEENLALMSAAVLLPSVFARSRTGTRLTRTLLPFSTPVQDHKENTMKMSSLPRSALRQTSLLMIVFSMLLGPVWPKVALAEPSDQNHAQVASDENAIAADDSDESDNSTTSNTVIAPGFKLRLSCDADKKINGSYRVTADGELSLPYQVTVHAGGMKVKALEKQLDKAYRSYFKDSAHIKVMVQQKRYAVKVTGVVKNPGTYLLKDHTTVDEALSMASVRTEDLSSGYVRVGMGKNGKWISMDDYMKGGPAHDLPAWRGGEQILFQLDRPEGDVKSEAEDEAISPSARKVEVLGEVKNPGPVSFQHHADGYYYLIQRGGPTQFSDLTTVEVLHTDLKTHEHTRVSLGDLKSVKDLHESDVMIVYPDRPSNFERGLAATGIVAAIVSAVVLTIFVARK